MFELTDLRNGLLEWGPSSHRDATRRDCIVSRRHRDSKMSVRERVSSVLATLPPARHAFAYGSAVLRDASVSNVERALDLVVVVDDPVRWHVENMEMNPSHYAGQMRASGVRGVDFVSRRLGVGAHYNSRLSDAHGRAFKYGVVGKKDLLDDMHTWRHLFVAGRMHKPHYEALGCEEVRRAQTLNIRAAARAALLTLPESFSEGEFHRAVVGLSYHGDIRFIFAAEDGKKIERIATANADEMREMYAEALAERVDIGTLSESPPTSSSWSQDKSLDTVIGLLADLPPSVLTMLGNAVRVPVDMSPEETATVVSEAFKNDSTRISAAVSVCLRQIVRVSSARQAFAALLSTSPTKTVGYVGAKFFKAASSLFEK